MAGLVGGPGAQPPGRRSILKILEKFLMKNCKNSIFFKKI